MVIDDEHARRVSTTCCNTLQYNATHCNTLQHSATPCNTLQPTATCCNTPSEGRRMQLLAYLCSSMTSMRARMLNGARSLSSWCADDSLSSWCLDDSLSSRGCCCLARSIYSVLRCVVVCCSVMWCIAFGIFRWLDELMRLLLLWALYVYRIAVCCKKVCDSVLQRVAVCCIAVCCSVLQCVAVCCSVMQCCFEHFMCTVLRCVARRCVAECLLDSRALLMECRSLLTEYRALLRDFMVPFMSYNTGLFW